MSEADQPHTLPQAARGLHGQLELSSDKVRIERKGLLAQAKGHDKEVPITEIASLQFREAGFITHGLIRLCCGERKLGKVDFERPMTRTPRSSISGKEGASKL